MLAIQKILPNYTTTMDQIAKPKVRIIDPPPFISSHEIRRQLQLLQKENEALKTRLTALENLAQALASKPGPSPAGLSAGPADDCGQAQPDKLEAWLRRNLAWLDEPCPFKKASSRTWRQMGGNEGEKISMNGKGLQVPRAYLHSIESWAEASSAIRLKARLALELAKV